MSDNVTFQATVATPPNGLVVRTKDRSGVALQLMGLDLNPSGSSEQLMSSPDGNLPARIKDLDLSIRTLIVAITQSPSFDSFDRQQVFVNGGQLGLISSLNSLGSITGTVNTQQLAPPFLQAPMFQVMSQVSWADCVRQRIG